jgi:glutamate 5-kinase
LQRKKQTLKQIFLKIWRLKSNYLKYIMKKKIIGIKLGSSSLVNDGQINHQLIKSVCTQVAALVQGGVGVFIVTSGAIASDQSENRSRNLRSAVGQIRIIHAYQKSLRAQGVDGAQMLLTDEQLVDQKSSRTQLTKKIMLEAFAVGVVPIINANDVIDSEEVKALEYCADNDRLFKLMCLLVGADVAIIGFDQLGLLDNQGQVVHIVNVAEMESVLAYAKGGSALGHGTDGMRTKILALAELAQTQMRACLAPAKAREFILRAVAQEENFGTRFCE